MTHGESQDLLLDLAYGELEPALATQVEEHVAACVECQKEQAALAGTRAAAAPLWDVEEPLSSFDERILASARAEASLQSDGLPGEVIETSGSVKPLGLSPADIDAHARVVLSRPARRPRWALRLAVGGSVAAAAALALVVGTSLAPSKQFASESRSEEFQIRVDPADPALERRAAKEQGAREARRQAEASKLAASPVELPGANTALAEAPSKAKEESGTRGALRGPAADRATAARRQGEREGRAQAAADDDLRVEEGGGGDVSDQLSQGTRGGGLAVFGAGGGAGPATGKLEKRALPQGSQGAGKPSSARPQESRSADEAQPSAPKPSAPQASTAAHAAPPPAVAQITAAPPAAAAAPAPQSGSVSPRLPSAPPPRSEPARQSAAVAAATEKSRVVAMAAPAADAITPAQLEADAQAARHAGNYVLAGALYRKAASLQRRSGGDPSTTAWDLAHAVECLSAGGLFDEARHVRDELVQAYPEEKSAFAATRRVLREVEGADRPAAKAAPPSQLDSSTPVDF